MRPINKDDVGTFWLGADGQVWELFAYCSDPTVSWRRVDNLDKQILDAAVGSPLAQEFTRLVVEVEPDPHADTHPQSVAYTCDCGAVERGDVHWPSCRSLVGALAGPLEEKPS